LVLAVKIDFEAKQLASLSRREQYPIWIARVFLYFWFFAGCVWCFRIGSYQGYGLLALIHVVFYSVRVVAGITSDMAKGLAAATELWARRHNQGMIDFWESMKASGKDAKFDWPSAGEAAASDMRSERLSKAVFNSRAGDVGILMLYAFWELAATILRLFLAAMLANAL
jgi:hypothetical protein